MIRKILCRFHEESTPSMVLYPDGYHCYGCGAYGPLEHIGVQGGELPPPVEPEDLEASLAYIESLPMKEYRGLMLHCDDECAYLVWPDRTYYKARYLDDRKSKYRNPKGHEQTILPVRLEGNPWLVVVEGELNALSIARAVPHVDVISPGSAGNFKSSALRKMLQNVVNSYNILIVADRDAAGADACIEVLGYLKNKVGKVKPALMVRDANQVLQDEGCEGLKTTIQKLLKEVVEKSPR